MELFDWSTYLMQAQRELKEIEDKLLHKNYNDIDEHISAINKALDSTMAWVVSQGSNNSVDVLEKLNFVTATMPSRNSAKPYLIAAIKEIEQLREGRKFWLQAGYDIGKK